MDNDLTQFSDQEILAKTLWGEARGEGYDGLHAVASVIMNRANRPGWWGTDARSVCLKPYQFSCWNESDPNRPKILALTTEFGGIYGNCLDLARMALSGELDDIVCGADSYEVIGTNAKWALGFIPVATVGRHEFFKTV